MTTLVRRSSVGHGTSSPLTGFLLVFALAVVSILATTALWVNRDTLESPTPPDIGTAAAGLVPATALRQVAESEAVSARADTPLSEGGNLAHTSTPADYFEQLTAAYAYFAAVYPAVGEDKLIEVRGPEGVFTVRISNHGFSTTLQTPGGNLIPLRSQESRTVFDVVESQGQLLFGIKGRGYRSYDPVRDELQNPVIWRTRSWDPDHGFGLERSTYNEGYPAKKAGPYYLFFAGTSPRKISGALSEGWAHLTKVVTMDLAERRMTQYHYEGPETGVLQKVVLTGPNLEFTFQYNASRGLRLSFSPETGFGEATFIPLQ